MDPNVSLMVLRDYLGAWRDNIPIGSLGLEDLMVTLEGLDEWLSKGGFLPKAWQREPIPGSPNRGLFYGDA